MNRIKHTDGVTSIYKRAAQATAEEAQEPCRQANLGSLNAAADLYQIAAAAVWAVYYACPVCGGTRMELRETETGAAYLDPCPLGHVEMVNPFDGSVVYADPKLAEWRCRGPQPECAADVSYPYQPYRFHAKCGWVPKPMEADNE